MGIRREKLDLRGRLDRKEKLGREVRRAPEVMPVHAVLKDRVEKSDLAEKLDQKDHGARVVLRGHRARRENLVYPDYRAARTMNSLVSSPRRRTPLSPFSNPTRSLHQAYGFLITRF